jgi:hypothetical protein
LHDCATSSALSKLAPPGLFQHFPARYIRSDTPQIIHERMQGLTQFIRGLFEWRWSIHRSMMKHLQRHLHDARLRTRAISADATTCFQRQGHVLDKLTSFLEIPDDRVRIETTYVRTRLAAAAAVAAGAVVKHTKKKNKLLCCLVLLWLRVVPRAFMLDVLMRF